MTNIIPILIIYLILIFWGSYRAYKKYQNDKDKVRVLITLIGIVMLIVSAFTFSIYSLFGINASNIFISVMVNSNLFAGIAIIIIVPAKFNIAIKNLHLSDIFKFFGFTLFIVYIFLSTGKYGFIKNLFLCLSIMMLILSSFISFTKKNQLIFKKIAKKNSSNNLK